MEPKDDKRSDYIDFGPFFKVKSRDFSRIRIHSDIVETIYEIYRELNNNLPFCKNSFIKEADRTKLYELLKKEGFGLLSSFIPHCHYAKKDSLLLLSNEFNDFFIAFEEYGENIGARFFYNEASKKHLELINKIIECHKPIENKGKVSLLLKQYGELVLSRFDVESRPIKLNHYNKDFEKALDKITEFINGDKSGIILFAGEPGVGKTSVLRGLTEISKNDIVYTTKNIAEIFDSPDFLSFATSELKNKVLVLEDIESAICTDGLRSSATANILGLADGLLGDILKIKIIATFNTPDLESIDKALLRKGRLDLLYKFEKLSISRTNELIKTLGKTKISEEPMTLADIYGLDKENGNTVKIAKFGF